MTKVACIGLGPRGSYLASMAAELAELTAMCDTNPEELDKTEALLKRIGVTSVRRYTSSDELFAQKDIEAVIIATPLPTHADLSIAAIEAGKHVYCEIPTFNSREEAGRLCRAVRAHPEVKFTAAENCCFWGFVESWKKMFEKGMLGEVTFAEAEYLHGSGDPPAKLTWRSYMPALRYLTHSLGPLLYILGDECTEVTGFEPAYNPYTETRPANPNGMAVIRTNSGRLLRVFMGFGAYCPCSHNYSLHGTGGTLQVQCNLEDDGTDDKQTLAHLKDLGDLPYLHGRAGVKIPFDLIIPDRPIKTLGHGGHGDVAGFKAFLKAVEEDLPAPLGFDFAYNMTMPGILADESARQGSIPVKMPAPETL